MRRRRWTGQHAAEEQEEIAQLPASDDDITELLGSIERSLTHKDGAVHMSDDVKSYALYVEKHLDKVTAGAKLSKEFVSALDALPWVGAGLTIIAMGLDMSLKMHDNKEQCSYLMTQYLDI
ncbi:hypothetical protein GOP47_0024564 [Adiantum capillus-veneris]|uniref:Uncharacterized protein n=1 Tax=Adiantum capillus-veneris TaxID=13818 RepID=A0A9D4Z3S7_ADICA|nr:hypothetical protein GOP47_0024564 [Adiantum capillus-veneris]